MALPHVFTVGADHPSLPGHFPGQPVVPGAVLLEAAIVPLLAAGRHRVTHLETAKFLAPVRFGEQVLVTFTDNGAGHISLDASTASATVLRCRLRLGIAT